ncbi:trehalose-phosphatase [Shimia ponticola]|uniref:trehalose-phosphatase n=1 Tax=Shimia ponticola TaxID=2582893 RepID=UPI0011BDC03A|nr:trehalose-phosphatase [Shimia ponticola]
MADPYQTPDRVAHGFPRLTDAALFLDFDGTLIGFADTPLGVEVPMTVPDLLGRLSRRTGGRTVILSGRRLEDFDQLLPTVTVPRVGSHGAEWQMDGTRNAHPLAGSEVVAGLRRAAEAFARVREGVIVEQKPAGVALHMRQAPELEVEVASFAARLAAAHPGFELHRGKMVCELRPDDVGKGAALERIMALPDFAGRTPVMMGDDATDEPAMDAAQRLGGVGVKVGEGGTCATSRLKDPSAVQECLRIWSELETKA